MLISGVGLMLVGLIALVVAFSVATVAISLGVGFVAVSIAVKTDRVLAEQRMSQVDEKIAIMFGYAAMFQSGPSRTAQLNVNIDLTLEKIITDMTAAARLGRPPPDQLTRLTRAVTGMVEQMRAHGFTPEAEQVQETFRTQFGGLR